MDLIREWIVQIWDWFWYYRRKKFKYTVFTFQDTYMAMASDGKTTVYHCYGSTPEAAKEMTFYRLARANKRFEN